MDRRDFLIGTGGALAARGLARAPAGEPVADYLARLRQGLDDGGGGAFADASEDRLLSEHNTFRRARALSPLIRNAALDLAARAHVADLLRRDYFAHASPEGFTSEHRVGLLARRFVGSAGENIAMQDGGDSRPTAADFARMWRNSPGHRTNMLRPEYTHVGFGVVAKGDRAIAGAVFGRAYAELAAPVPFRIGRGNALAGVLDGAAPALIGYELDPMDGGAAIGPFRNGAAPSQLASGAYAIRPHAPDLKVPNRYWILFGPIVVAS